MEPALKQRLIGATVLVALAVIFLPMLIKGPAPESGVSDVPLQLPDTPEGDYETRELPLVAPGDTPAGGALGMDVAPDALPTVDADAAAPASASAGSGMMPAPTAGGSHAVTFGSYATAADAERVVAALAASQLPGYQEPVKTASGRTLYRVLIGPYSSQAIAESARLRAAHVRDDVGAKVVVLDARDEEVAPAAASVSQPAPLASASVSRPVALGESRSATAARLPEAPKPAATAPKPVDKTPVAVPTPKPAASNVGFAVQLGAFSHAEEATRLRDRARAAGFSAFVESVRTDKGTLSRVRVGPVADRAAADRLQAQVAAKLGVSGIVRPHP